jgi:hypothetical protein
MKAASIILFLLVIVGAVSCEVSLWQECRANHSWFYCVRTLHPGN